MNRVRNALATAALLGEMAIAVLLASVANLFQNLRHGRLHRPPARPPVVIDIKAVREARRGETRH